MIARNIIPLQLQDISSASAGDFPPGAICIGVDNKGAGNLTITFKQLVDNGGNPIGDSIFIIPPGTAYNFPMLPRTYGPFSYDATGTLADICIFR